MPIRPLAVPVSEVTVQFAEKQSLIIVELYVNPIKPAALPPVVLTVPERTRQFVTEDCAICARGPVSPHD